MRIISLLFLLMLTCLPFCEIGAENVEVLIGNESNRSYNTPFCNYYLHGAVQMIYSANEIEGSGTIKSIAFKVASPKEYATTGVKIYMGHKSSSTFAGKSDYVPFSELTLVYSGTPTLGLNKGWEEYTLNKPFFYNGTNLVVAIEKHANQYDNSLTYYSSSKSNMVLIRQSDNVSDYGDLSKQIDFSTSSERPDVRLDMDIERTTINGITYTCANGKAKACQVNSNTVSEVIIPESITSGGKTYIVTSMNAKMFDGQTSLTSVTLPSTITEIPDYAFNNCSSLESITIPSSVNTIGTYAFYGCKSLTSLTIPSNVKTLAPFCFFNCSGLKELYIEDSSEPLCVNNGNGYYGMFKNSPLTSLYIGRDLEYYDDFYASPFYNKTEKIHVTIGNQVKKIGNYLFYSGTGLNSIFIPSNVESIGEKAFYGCNRLVTVVNSSKHLTVETGSEGNGYLGYYAQNVINGDEFGKIGDFNYCAVNGHKTLYEYFGTSSEVTIPSGYELSNELFKGNKNITSVTLTEGLSSISDYCFYECTNLKQLTIPKSVNSIGKYAFAFSGMEGISIPKSVKSIGDHAFYRCDNMENLSFEEGSITRIEDFCFCYCRKMVNVHIPQSVNYIGRGAFYECDNLESINIPAGVTRLGCFAFKNCINLKEIIIPESIDSIEMHTFYYCRSLAKVVLPTNLKHIGNSAFSYCGALTECEIPASVRYIGNMALKSCSKLLAVDIPEGIEYLGQGAFSNCSALKSIVIPSIITKIPYAAFSGCYNLREVQLPDNLTDIDDCAFSGCAISSINWPSTLKSVGYLAFSGSSNLKCATIPKADIYGKLILSGNEPMDKIYCFADIILPDSVFRVDAVYNSTLYVKPTMLEAYRKSKWASRFKAILPLGDINSDGKYSVSDVTMFTDLMNEKEFAPFNNYRFTSCDINGDGKADIADLNQVVGHVLNNDVITPFVPLPEEEPQKVNQLEPSDGCMVLYTIASYDSDTRLALDYINELRYEACIEGVPNPDNTNNFLKESDYVPIKWSTDLERCSRVRCSESLYTCGHHSRLNGKSIGTVAFNGVSAGSECLGWGFYGSVMGSINGYYEEKYDLVYHTGGVVGHYTNFITPSHTYVGVAAMSSCASMETWRGNLSDIDSYFLPPSGIDTIRLDVKKDYIVGYRVGTTNSINDQSVKTGTYQKMAIFANIIPYPNSGGYVIVPNEGTFESSDPEIASIDEKGYVHFKKAGQVTVTGYLNGENKGSRVFTVSCSHDYYYDPIVNNKATGKCAKCGEETSVSLPTSLTIYWSNSTDDSGHYYFNVPQKNPVGSYVSPWIYNTGGTYPYNTVIVENDRPDLLETTETASSITNWLVKGVGVAHVTFICKYNPSIKRTYTINLTEPEESNTSQSKRRIANVNSGTYISIPENTPSVEADNHVNMVTTNSAIY